MNEIKNKQYPYGYYKVGTELFDHKITALIRASETQVRPTWHFHNATYSKLNWQTDIPISLNQIYQQRATQLRENYDYIVISFSGGSDSWTVVNSFIESKNHIDEIFIRWPIAATNRHKANSVNLNASNILSEWELTITPFIKEFQKLIPNTKITIYDWSNKLLTTEIADNDWLLTQDFLNIGSFLKFQASSNSEQRARDLNLKTAIVFGTDKPQLCSDNGKIYCYFLDKLANCHAYGENRVSELFYWTPDLPEITLVQARVLFNYIKLNKHIANLINISTPFNIDNKTIWNAVARSNIYLEYCKLGTFQSKKSSTNVLDEGDAWIWKCELKNERYVQSWKYGLDNIINSIKPEYFDRRGDEITGFNGFISEKYYLGDINQQDN